MYLDWAGDGQFVRNPVLISRSLCSGDVDLLLRHCDVQQNENILQDYGLANITIWNDENENGVIDFGEALGETDENGNFSFPAPTVNNTALIFRGTGPR